MENTELTVKEAINKYLEEANIKPVTLDMNRGSSNSESFKKINNIKIKDLDQATLRAWVDTLVERGFSAHTIKNYFGIVKKAVKFSCDLLIDCKLPTREPTRIHNTTLTENLLTQILLCCDEVTMKGVLLSYYANANNHEVCSLTYKDVFYDTNAICLYSNVKLENGTWNYYENGPQDQTIRFALIPQNVMEFIGRGEPNQKVVPLDYKYLGTKFGTACRKNNIDYYFKKLKTAALYKRINVNPLGIIENQHLFAFGENKDLNVIDCINKFIEKGGRNDYKASYTIEIAYKVLSDKTLGELSKEVLEKWTEDLCKNYAHATIIKYFYLLDDALLDVSNGKFHMQKWHLDITSKKVKKIKIKNKEVLFDKEAVRRLFDYALPELKKALLLSGYGGFGLSELTQIKVKDIDRERLCVSYGKKVPL